MEGRESRQPVTAGKGLCLRLPFASFLESEPSRFSTQAFGSVEGDTILLHSGFVLLEKAFKERFEKGVESNLF